MKNWATGKKIGAATMENSTRVPQKLKTELPPDPGIPGLGIYPEELNSDLEEQRAPQVHCGIIRAAREGAKGRAQRHAGKA